MICLIEYRLNMTGGSSFENKKINRIENDIKFLPFKRLGIENYRKTNGLQ